MTDPESKNELKSQEAEAGDSTIRIPGFLNDEDIGLGDAIKELTSAIGIRPCGECERRAARLNRLVLFSARRRK